MMRSAGLVSTEKYEAEKFAIEEKYAALKRQLQESQMASDIKLQAATLETAKQQQPALKQAAEDAMDKFKAAAVNAADKASATKIAESNFEIAQKALLDFKEKHDDKVGIFEQLGTKKNEADILKLTKTNEFGLGAYGDVWKDYKKWSDLTENVNREKDGIESFYEAQSRAEAAAKVAQEESSLAQQRAVKNQEYTTQGNVDLRNKIITYNAQREMNQQLGAIEHNANQDRLEGQYAARERQLSGKAQFTDDEAQSAQFLQGRHPGISLDQHLAQFQASTDRIHGTIKDFARRIAATQDKLDKDVQTIAQELNNQQSSIRANLDH